MIGAYLGRVDECGGGVVAGWAYHPDSGGKPLQVEILVDEEIAAVGTADLFRDDLRAAGIGDGHHAFRVDLPLTVGRAPIVSVRVRVRGAEAELEGSPRRLELWAADSPHRFRVHVDHVEGTRLIGWAVDTHRPEQSPEVMLHVDEELVGTARCGIERPDVAEKQGVIANARCGFALTVAEPFCDGAERDYRLMIRQGVAAPRTAATMRLAFLPTSIGYIERLQRGKLVGWAIDPSRPAADLDVFVDGVFYARVQADEKRPEGEPGAPRHGFEIDFGLVPSFSGAIEVDVRFAGEGVPLKRSPMRLDCSRMARPPLAWPVEPSRSISVIVPIHDGVEEVRTCLNALLRFTPAWVRIVLIDDASADTRIAPLLADLVQAGRVVAQRNERNLGYTRTVNLGVDLAGEDDVVLLNSDTVVGPRWLENMAVAAASAPDIGTVTAVSDNAGAFSVPESNRHNAIPAWADGEDSARLIAQTAAGLYPETPTGNGFCLYVRRAMLGAVGRFDEAAFPRGYGEENDLCMRAQRAGWRHIVDDRTFVRHAKGASFGAERDVLLARARGLIHSRYPDYPVQVERFADGPAMRSVRHRVRSLWEGAVAMQRPPRPRLLFVLSTHTGGTPQTTRDLLRALRHLYHPLLLTCDAEIVRLFDCDTDAEPMLAEHRLSQPVHLAPHTSADYDAVVRRWLTEHAVELVHIRHIAWHSLNLPRLCRGLGIPVVFSFHDFYTVCPTVNLVDENEQFCGGTCSATAGDCTVELWKRERRPPLKHAWIGTWRAMMTRTLADCDAFVATSPAAAALLVGTFPELSGKPFPVIPHGRDFPELRDGLRVSTNVPERTRPIRIVCPGNLGVPKGANLIRALKALDAEGRLEFHFLGDVYPGLRGIGQHHGRYARSDLHAKIAAIEPHFVGLFSIWPETFSHTLTEAWASGIPVIASGVGALGERVRQHGGGWLLENLAPEAVYRTILAAAGDPDAYMRRLQEIVRWQRQVGRAAGTAQMAVAYHDLYRDCLADVRRAGPVTRSLRIGFVARAAARWLDSWRNWQSYRGFAEEIALVPLELDVLLDMDRAGDLDAVLIDQAAVPPGLDQAVAETCRKLGLPLIGTSGSGSLSLKTLPPALPEFAWLGPRPASEPAPVKTAGTIRLLCHAHEGDLDAVAFLASVTEQLRARFPVELLIIGTVEAPNPACIVLPQPEDAMTGGTALVHWFRGVAATCDIGLDFGSPRSREALDAPGFFEFAAVGLPCVQSRAAETSDFIQHLQNGLLADNLAADWLFSLGQLCSEPALRARIGRAAQDTVLARHLMRHQAPAYVAAFRDIVAAHPRGIPQPDLIESPPRRRRAARAGRPFIVRS